MFLGLLRRAVCRYDVELHAFALMSNHFHLLLTPRTPAALPAALKELNAAYTRHHNKRHDRIGTVWCGRYRGILIDDEGYWLTCLRYIEQNPVRAGLVVSADQYPWSSYPAHAFGHWPEWLTPHAIYMSLGKTMLERQAAYLDLSGQPLPEACALLLREGVRPGSDSDRTPIGPGSDPNLTPV